ncbi:glycine--tRNA ligase subunit beta [Buchnera aphidicola]|uniref:glycine--tRNA ligase subunit beta n=1 Tax=Buchnera aphidicola TaxID=9 RepID=UPI0031B877BC
MKKIFLFELGTEQLPAKTLKSLSKSFFNNFEKLLNIYNVKYKKIFWFATSRRLAIKIYLTNKKKCSSSFKEKKINETLKKNLKNQTKSKKDIDLISKIISFSFKKIDSSKLMIWEDKKYKFYRPVRYILALLNSKIVDLKLFNICSNRVTEGHFLMEKKKITLNHAADYPIILKNIGKVLPNYEERKQIIYKKMLKKIKKINGVLNVDKSLLEEITSSVEWPNVLIGKFKKKFLKIPLEILKHVIQNIQKCFLLYEKSKKLKNYFLIISDILTKKYEKIIIGNEIVIHSRLSDINFFLKKDRLKNLESYLPNLKNVIFQEKLGTLFDKTIRLKKLSTWICKFTGANEQESNRAAELSKCDLVTNMVFEFPELQGIIGSYYAFCDKESISVINAIKNQYCFFKKSKEIPSDLVCCTLLIADKIDTISSMFLINKIPSGEKDPFSLRRAALSIIKIIINNQIYIDLIQLIKKSIKLTTLNYKKELVFQIKNFFLIRLYNFYKEKGYPIKIIKSVLDLESNELTEINNKIIELFSLKEKLKLLITIFKRIQNILKKNNKKINYFVNEKLLIHESEIKLFFELKKYKITIKKLLSKKKYKESLLKIINLIKFIENFFEQTIVYDKNDDICLNRLSLLNEVKKIFLKITNFALLI